MKKKAILLLFLAFVFIIPQVRSMEKIEKTVLCQPLWHIYIAENIELDKYEIITWEFETFNETFEASLFIRKSSSSIYIELVTLQTENIGEYQITQTTFYVISIVNFGSEGYVHIVIENKESSISSYPIILVVFFSILGLIIYKRKKIVFH